MELEMVSERCDDEGLFYLASGNKHTFTLMIELFGEKKGVSPMSFDGRASKIANLGVKYFTEHVSTVYTEFSGGTWLEEDVVEDDFFKTLRISMVSTCVGGKYSEDTLMFINVRSSVYFTDHAVVLMIKDRGLSDIRLE